MQISSSRNQLARKNDRAWIPCAERLPNANEYVIYCTPHYQVLGKRDREKWYRSAFSLELEENPVVCWRPIHAN